MRSFLIALTAFYGISSLYACDDELQFPLEMDGNPPNSGLLEVFRNQNPPTQQFVNPLNQTIPTGDEREDQDVNPPFKKSKYGN